MCVCHSNIRAHRAVMEPELLFQRDTSRCPPSLVSCRRWIPDCSRLICPRVSTPPPKYDRHSIALLCTALPRRKNLHPLFARREMKINVGWENKWVPNRVAGLIEQGDTIYFSSTTPAYFSSSFCSESIVNYRKQLLRLKYS